MVCALDLNVFFGDFSCCARGHVGQAPCDCERLRTPILGIFAQYLRQVMREQGAGADHANSHVLPMERIERDKIQMFIMDKDLTSSVQIRDLLGPLPEMVEERIRASAAAHNELSTRLDVGMPGVESVQQEQSAVFPSCGPPFALTLFQEDDTAPHESAQVGEEEEEITDLDSPSEKRSSRGQCFSIVPCSGDSKTKSSAQEEERPYAECGKGSGEHVEEKSGTMQHALSAEGSTNSDAFFESELLQEVT